MLLCVESLLGWFYVGMICEESVQAIACRKGNIYIECVKTKHIMCNNKIF